MQRRRVKTAATDGNTVAKVMEPLPSDRITSVHCTICNRSWLHPCPEHSQPATHSHSIYYPPAYPAHVAVLFCKLTYITVAIDIGHNLIHFCEFSWGICESKIPSKGNEQVRGEVPGSTLLACLHKWSSLFLRTVRSSLAAVATNTQMSLWVRVCCTLSVTPNMTGVV